jgi:hypothetical protein
MARLQDIQRGLRWLALPLFVFALACSFKPNMSQAMSTKNLAEAEPVDDIDQAIADARADLVAQGYTILLRADGLNMATVLPNDIVLLPLDFEDKPKPRQLRMLRHEAVHGRQLGRGKAVFLIKYAHESGRWALEMQGYRQEVRDMCSSNTPRADIAVWIDHRAKTFARGYFFTPKNHERVREATREALTLELELCEGSKE